MATYATNQPAGRTNRIERVAIVGAGGTLGSRIVAALLETGKHRITALSRKDSNNKIPDGVHIAHIDYNDEASMVAALKGQQFFIITMSPTAPRDTHSKLVKAAAKAGVPYIMPNGYGGDIEQTKLGDDTFLGPPQRANREEIERLGMKWITMCCGFWYDYSVAGGESRFGFDLNKRTVTLFDGCNTKTTMSTLSQVAKAVATVLSLKERPEDEIDTTSLTLSSFSNKPVYVGGFLVSQNEAFESIKRVTATTDADWTITHESSKKRYQEGLGLVQKGDMTGFSKLLYSRALFPEEPSEFSAKAQNAMLGLRQETLDDGTRQALEIVDQLNARPERMAA